MLGTDDDVASGHVPCGDQGGQRRRRRRVLDVSVPAVGKSEQLTHPVGDAKLELGRRGRCAPDDRHLVERRGDELRENSRLRRGHGEVGEKARAVPVRDPGQNDRLKIREQRFEGLRPFRSLRGQARGDFAGQDLRKHGITARLREIPFDPSPGCGKLGSK